MERLHRRARHAHRPSEPGLVPPPRRVDTQIGPRLGGPTAIAIVDLDRFKEVNDTLGHQNGDQLLAELARRLAAETRLGDTVARLGGDEFGLILDDVIDPNAALRRMRDIIHREARSAGLPLSVEASIGYVVAPEDGTDVDELLQRADIAMYVAKEQRSGVIRYEPSQNQYDPANLGLIAELAPCNRVGRARAPLPTEDAAERRARRGGGGARALAASRRTGCCTRPASWRLRSRRT